jgi:hypothetical protein
LKLSRIVDKVGCVQKASQGKAARRVDAAVPRHPPTSATFESHLRDSVAGLRESVADVLGAVGANVSIPHSITRDFGVDKSLAAKLGRVIRESDPYAAALDIPGEEAMRIFARTMRDAGAPGPKLDALRESVESFQQMVKTHCGGDRATLEMLAASAASSTAGAVASVKQQQQLETFRKHMFRGASAVFGVQAQAQVSADFLSPTRRDDDRYDVTLVNGLVDLRRIRSDVTWAVSSMRNLEQDGRAGPLVPFEPIDITAGKNGQAPLIRDYCSQPVPELRITDTKDLIRRFELPEGPVGSASAVTLFTGWTYRSASLRYREGKEILREHFVSLNTPVELVIHDLYMHKDLMFARRPSVHLYSALPGGVSYPNGPRDRGLLQLSEPLQDLSGLPVRPLTMDVPNYPRLVQHVVEHLGFSMNDFFGVRMLLRYPPIPSILMYRYELPEKR